MLSINHILATGGLLLIAAIIFAESGMFIGFFFPGDTLLIGAGVFAEAGKFNLLSVIVVVAVAAILGDNVGYHIGKRYGRRLFKKPDGIIFRQEYITRAEAFFDRYGSKTMLFAHFVPVIRTFAPPVAGVGRMSYREFIMFDAVGDTAWAAAVTLIGYWFGSKIPNIDHYILAAVGVVILVTIVPTLYHLQKAVREKKSVQASPKPDSHEPKP
jgi:membrane-associated protein